MATTTVALSVVAVIGGAPSRGADRRIRIRQCRHLERRAGQRADLCRGDGIARRLHVERHGDRRRSTPTAFARFNKQIAEVVEDWKKSVRGDDADRSPSSPSASRSSSISATNWRRLATEVSPAAGRVWGDNDANRAVRKALNTDLEKLAQVYEQRATRVYRAIDAGIDKTAAVAQPARRLRRRAGGRRRAGDLAQRDQADRRDHARHRSGRRRRRFDRRCRSASAATRSARWRARSPCSSAPCARTKSSIARCAATPKTRAQRQEQMSNEISRFSAEVEATLAELGRISDQMLAASSQLAGCRRRSVGQDRARGRPPPRRPPPMCATSPPPPTNCRRR